jgi:hypothetical protein
LACRSPNLQQQSGRLQIPVTMPRHLLLTWKLCCIIISQTFW